MRRHAGGGAFLGEFVPDGLPWVHLDIAGPAFNQGAAWGYTPKGGTGAGVRTIVAAVPGWPPTADRRSGGDPAAGRPTGGDPERRPDR